jgi:hypothetical protein
MLDARTVQEYGRRGLGRLGRRRPFNCAPDVVVQVRARDELVAEEDTYRGRNGKVR